ncbi:AAA family ATPase [Fodinisporobacter ferrooxydans]|uniref:AAA family ATPase n=1 Tax=Fodinisporobacter ferrooxydans TaxID=2901836 RepID=A0ABY4CM01_9BACL|nr:AAA family ATPase [Alicyclobacillaceae bacterium MYW30-H2]
MKCQNCKQNPATIEMQMNINGKTTHAKLCQTCYRNMGTSLQTRSLFDAFFPMFNQMNQAKSFGSMGNPNISVAEQTSRGSGVLDQLGKNISAEAQANHIDPVIGRDREIEQVIEILSRRNKNNPVLIGEPGVGKTAIAEGLALKIANAEVPAKLLNKTVYTLDVATLVAGTGIRGQFEEKMKAIIEELQDRSDILLFIDEIHLLVGAGKAEGSMDAGNILKPALARGELQLIGATTLKEYRQIEKDAALERRFQPVMVDEPTNEEAIEILKGLQDKYEQYHNIRYSDEAIQACVTLSKRYIQDRFLPDKAIDLMDQAGARKSLDAQSGSTTELESKLQQVRTLKQQATAEEKYEKAAELRDQEWKLEKELAHAKEHDTAIVQVEDIQWIIEKKTGIPVRKLQRAEQNKMKHLQESLAAKVIGQDQAVEKVAKAIRRNRTGLVSKSRPIASFLFVGPTGVGKTELAKCLAEEMFGSKDAMIRLDMSEYMEKHSVSKIIGAPPGYVGFDEAGQLTERIRRNPYAILLIDEVEKAHPDVLHLFLQILEDGRLTDSQGKTVSFKDTVIIMTSNAGATDGKKIAIGFDAREEDDRDALLEQLGQYFRPEFLNRFDAILSFNRLTKEHLVRIVDLMLNDLIRQTAEQGLTVTVSEAAKEKLAELGYHPAFGARPLRRTIQEFVEDGISDVLLDEESVKHIEVLVENNQITVKHKQSA